MKKIVPFNNILTFNTDVSEINAISLEHKINKSDGLISGIFYISGEYKITIGGMTKEKFNFDLPFEIALGTKYDMATLVIDIDDFRYELVENNKLKVNIDVYVDGEIIPEVSEVKDDFQIVDINELDMVLDKDNDDRECSIDIDDSLDIQVEDTRDLLDDMLVDDKEIKMETETINKNNDDISIVNSNQNTNLFNSFNDNEEYVTYRVYRVKEGDSLDYILSIYNISKDDLMIYNSNIDNIIPGDKLIIPNK